ncbi:MAG: bifunctional phosphoglucose/phosphomannose isomerase [Bacteroidota bacterium]|jgi:glucose/mannose-6-phosphate isomerase
MKQLIENFSEQINAAIEIGKKFKASKTATKFENVVVSGLGGSGIGADLTKEYVAAELKIPFLVIKDYIIPNFINDKTLFIASSYSGNTEETLSSIELALKKKAHIICVTSGGKLAEIATKKKLDLILIPAGMPPRACLAYSAVQQLYILKQLNLLKKNFEIDLIATSKLLKKESKNIQKSSINIASKLYQKMPIIYAVNGMEAVAVRFRQQVNENGKQLCMHHIIPEMNHNELVGWRTKDDNLAVVIFRNKEDFSRSQTRVELNKKIFKQYTPHIIEIWSKGESHLQRALYLIHVGDWISWHLSVLRNFDCTEVKVIDWLKGELAKK